MLPFAFWLGLYLLSLTQVHTFDALSYILDVDRKPWPELFHPHHLAYGPLGALIRSGAHALGWHGSAAALIQATNALAGAAGVALFARLAQRATGRVDLAAAGALLLGSSYAFWYYAVEVEVYTIAALGLIIALALLLALLRSPSPALAAALGVAQGLAVLFHQTNAEGLAHHSIDDEQEKCGACQLSRIAPLHPHGFKKVTLLGKFAFEKISSGVARPL